jgi:threonine dehydrogenase-like Zn-dependent dehydrogenase
VKGAVFLGERKIELREFPDPTPGAGEVVLKMKASGMCGSDLHFYRAPRDQGVAGMPGGPVGEPVIAGHEPCGVVAAVGPCVPEALAFPGMRVMVHHYKGCGACNYCREGWAQLCANKHTGFVVYGGTAHGGHAEYLKVQASTLVPLPDELSFEVGAAISCGTGTAFAALRRMGVSGRDTIAIFGQGPVGLSATQLAKAMGARVIALDVNDARLALAKDLGADATINNRKDDPVAAIKELTRGEFAESTMDCSGNPDARLAAVRATRVWGTACMVGEGNELTLNVSADLLRRQLTLIGSWTFSATGLADCARFIADRRIAAEQVFTDRYRLDEAVEAYRRFDTGNTGKGVFIM